jgi:hypothetical protein
MLQDINGKDVTFWNGEKINSLEELKADISYQFNLKRKDILGFAKFKPFMRGDNSFSTQLSTGVWYPIINANKGKDLYITLPHVHKTHLGLFESIVPINDDCSRLDHLKNDKPAVITYFNRKEKEKISIEKSIQKAQERFEILDNEYKELNKLRGQKVHQKVALNNLLKDPSRKEHFFRLMQSDNYLSEVKKDIAYRIKTIEIYHSISSDKDYKSKFKNASLKKENTLKSLELEINAFDFKNEKSFDVFKPEKTIESYLQGKLSKIFRFRNKNKLQ